MTTQENIINKRLELWLHIGVWTLFVIIHALIFTRFLTFEISLIRSIANVVPMVFIFYINIFFVNKYLEKKQYVIYGGLILVLFLFFTYVRTLVNTQFPEVRREIIAMNDMESWGISAILTNLSVLILSVFYQILYNRHRIEQRNLAIINEQKEAQLQFLRGQINPHFLFNTLNNIYSLAVVRSEKTAPMVLQLSNLLRYVIYDSRLEQVTLKREIEHIQQFIELFQMRSETPLQIHFNIIGVIQGIKIEPMILIPIIENCFKHCDFDTNPSAFVKIDLQVDTQNIHLKTRNSKNDYDQQKDKVGGVGLENIRKRLELKYKDNFQLSVIGKKNEFTVDLKLTII